MSPIKVFWIEPVAKYRHEIRRFAHSDVQCPAKPYGMSCHDARVPLGDVESAESLSGYNAAADGTDSWKSDHITRADVRWPSHCACGYAFADDDAWQVNYEPLYEAKGGPHDGALFTLRDAPPGAMWDATWLHDVEWAVGPDGIALHVQLPNGIPWNVDHEASNCTRTQWLPGTYVGEDGIERHAEKMWKGRTHYCWIRHGDPRTGEIHVDKNGDTCAAGAGSILSGSYHGFLHNGYLTDG
jgi:hypothetical protein